jgi:hypothetical protein
MFPKPLIRLRVLLVASAAALAAVVAAMLVVLPAAATGTGNRLDAKVVATKPGPLPACSQDGSDCTNANVVREFIYVENGNALLNLNGGTRATVPNGFVLSSIDQATFVNGVQDHDFDFTFTPPPNPSDPPSAGRWPMTVTCPPEGPPCTAVGSPAVVPGEETAVFWVAWAHGNAEPNGTYVFKFTVHGTLNGTAVTLRASSPPIVMTA